VARDEAPSLTVRLASQSAFRQANLEFNPALSALRFNLERRNDASYVVRITSLQPVNEPYLDVLLELTWATGRVLREYTVLLDPPALRATPDVLAPVTPPAAITPAPVSPPAVAQVPAPAPAPVQPPIQPARPAAPVPAPAAAAAAPPTAPGTYTVRSGDTLSKIALQNKIPAVSLDQMLVALFRANPQAFVGDNMNRLIAGRTVSIPPSAEAQVIEQRDARREVVAQSSDFAQYKSRLAQVATKAAPVASAPPPAAAAQGRVTAKVEDKSAAAKAGDQLKIARADAPATGAAAAARAKDEEAAKQRALKEQEERAAALKKANEELKKALQLQSKAGTQAQAQAEAKKQVEAKPPEPVKAAPPPAPVAVAPVPATPPVEPAKAPEPAKSEVAKPVETKAAPPPQPEPSSGLLDWFKDSSSLGLIGILVLLGGALIGLNIYRKRKVEKTGEFRASGEAGMRANSLFGQTGGQSVDTGATSTFNSSFIPAASQLDSNEVDPVAEADVYIAYGREEQAEDILKEALRLQPDRHTVRVKLLEIYSRRGDKASFNAVADELRQRTGGVGDDWERAQKLGRSLDPSNPAFAGAVAAGEAALRGPTTELRLNPSTISPRPITVGPPAETASTAPTSVLQFDAPSPAARQLADTKLTDSVLSLDTKMTADTSMPLETSQSSSRATPTFAPTLPLDEGTKTVAGSGTIDPFGATAADKIDFAALDFDLGATTSMPQVNAAGAATRPFDLDLETPTKQPRAPATDFARPTIPAKPAQQQRSQPTTALDRTMMPDVDLTLPGTMAPAFSRPGTRISPPPVLDDSLSRPTLLGEVGALPDEQAPRLTSNTDQATVPLIDFDLTGSDVELGGRRTETQAGSPLAAQMSTKLDLARGYIDLGVKDGARELLEEVMRDGTREQRQQAVDLLKQVEV